MEPYYPPVTPMAKATRGVPNMMDHEVSLNQTVDRLKINDPSCMDVSCLKAQIVPDLVEADADSGTNKAPCRTYYSAEMLARLSEGLRLSTYVQNLDLHGCSIRDQGAVILCLKLPAQLTAIDLSWNSISNAGCEAIGNWMSDCAFQLRELKLKSNRIEDEGAIHLSTGLANCGECFEILDLSLNNVESAGVIAIATGLEGCKVLKELDLSSNAISDDAVTSLTALMRCASTLTILNLNNNAISTRASPVFEDTAAELEGRCEVTLGELVF